MLKLLHVVLVLSLTVLAGRSGAAQLPDMTPQVVKDFAAQVDAKLRPLLEKAAGSIKLVTKSGGVPGMTQLTPGVFVTLVYQASARFSGDSVESKFKEVIKELGGTYTKTEVQGGNVMVGFTRLTIGGFSTNGNLSAPRGGGTLIAFRTILVEK